MRGVFAERPFSGKHPIEPHRGGLERPGDCVDFWDTTAFRPYREVAITEPARDPSQPIHRRGQAARLPERDEPTDADRQNTDGGHDQQRVPGTTRYHRHRNRDAQHAHDSFAASERQPGDQSTGDLVISNVPAQTRAHDLVAHDGSSAGDSPPAGAVQTDFTLPVPGRQLDRSASLGEPRRDLCRSLGGRALEPHHLLLAVQMPERNRERRGEQPDRDRCDKDH